MMYEILLNRAIIKLEGKDALKLLQSLMTNDVKNNIYCYSYFLNNQGRYLFDLFIYQKSAQEFLLDIATSSAGAFMAKLKMYKLRSEAIITDVSSAYSIVYSTEQLAGQGVVYGALDGRYEQLGYRSFLEQDYAQQLKNSYPDQARQGLYLEDKYKFAIPDGETDLIFEKSIIVEYGAQELNAVSYTKGCYIGQEVISRVKYQGVVRKKLFKIETEDEIADDKLVEKAILLDDLGNEIGVLCSRLGRFGIILAPEERFVDRQGGAVFTVSGKLLKVTTPRWR
jgi:folate-binding protein YgfZ